ncbi:MAG TPA: phosphoenolpyruvate synthase regulatory protein [Rhodospirillaceae bacterium]|nr:kinase/pyrophosphorylase [Alphaproteobacteria bacterium]HBH26681.1 phosphoenolpyruvate synthase regulatory protein [Rhodospirillaceae bacterium]
MGDSADSGGFVLHLVSDATGTTLLGLARACVAQFDGARARQRFWPLIRTRGQLERVMEKIEAEPGPVIFTFIDREMRAVLEDKCGALGVPCVAVLDPILRALSAHLGQAPRGVPGLQYALDADYFRRVGAIDFAIAHDDGCRAETLKEAEVVLVGPSRTSKTPTAIFLARRGIKAANIPLAPGVEMAESLFTAPGPFYVGLVAAPSHLVEVRRTRLRMAGEAALAGNTYLDEEAIIAEVRAARRLFARHGWPVIDVTRRSVEETAAEVLGLFQEARGEVSILP